MARAILKDELTGKKTIEVEEEKRYSIPQEDDDGTIPEFVNITGKTQIIAVPYEPTESIRVPPWGILTGSQWRKPYASANKKWRFPPFRERVKTDEKYDEKYILSEKQVLTELEKLWTNDPDDTDRVKKRIQSLVDNMVIGKDGVRHMDDRVSVLTMMTDKIRKLEAKREQVLNGVGR